MLRRIVDFSLENRPLVLIAAVLTILGGGYAAHPAPDRRLPDITNVQVQVLTKAPALGPVEMEQFITYPVEAAMNGLPRLHEIRSVSRYGLSAVTVVFEDGVDVYFARQLVNERLAQARETIPPGLGTPEMGPVTTGLGDVFQFTVEGEGGLRDGAAHHPRLADRPAPAGRARCDRGERVGGPAQAVPGGGGSGPAARPQDRAQGRLRGRAERHAQRGRGLHRAQPGAVHPARRGPRRVARRHREDRPPCRRGRHAGDGGERRPGPRGGDAAHRRRHDRRPGRDRDRPRPDAGRGERASGGESRPTGGRGAAAVPAPGRPDRPLLRPRGPRPPRHPHGRDEPRRGRRSSSWRSCSRSSATSGRA